MHKWSDLSLTAAQAGIELREDYNGQHNLALAVREKRPLKTFGLPIGCPWGFDPTPMDDVHHPSRSSHELPSDLERLLAAYVNEAYDRGILV